MAISCTILLALLLTIFISFNPNQCIANRNNQLIERQYNKLDASFNTLKLIENITIHNFRPKANVPKIINKVVVALDGSGNYRSIQEAVNAATRRPQPGRFEIYIKRGTYNENVYIPFNANDVTMTGDGKGRTIIVGNKHVGEPGVGTYNSATLGVDGYGFILKGITVRNAVSDHEIGQAVAMRSISDHAIFYQCSFEAYIDTLYLFPSKQFFRECDIYGSVDIICGDSTVVFQNCNIYLRKSLTDQIVITAQRRGGPDSSGFVFHNSKVIRTNTVPAQMRVFLGRPWERYSRVVYLKTYLDWIDPLGWEEMADIKDGDLVYYGEYMNSGPGSNTKNRIKWKGVRSIYQYNEASQFSVRKFLDGGSWLAGNGVPFDLDI